MTVETAYRVSPLNSSDPRELGGYQLVGRLGSGGMGVVYLGTGGDGQHVAIKLVHAGLGGDEEFRRRFRSEVQRARQVPPFCTAEVLDADLDHEPPYLVVEYVDGPSLAEVVEERGPLTAANLHSVAIGVATALTAIHGAGVIHRDLKPRNVLLAPGSPKVIDFGIARALEATSQHTNTDQMVGTVAYMSPERFDSAPGTPLTAAADVFAWGVVVAYAGTGRTPFNGDSPPATAGRILTQPPNLDGLPEPLRGLVELALVKDPMQRPTARELLDLLLASGPQRAPQLQEALRRQPALRTAASDAQATTGEQPGEQPGAPIGDLPFREVTAAAALTHPLVPGPAGSPALPPLPARRTRHVRRSPAWRWVTLVAAALLVAGIAVGIGVLGSGTRTADERRDAAPAADGAAAGTVVGPVSAAPSSAAASASATPTPTPSATSPAPQEPAPKPTTIRPKPSVPRAPAGGESIIQDPLNTPGLWLDSEIREESANCFTRGTMRAARVDRGVYQCAGPQKTIEGDHSIAVNTTLESPGSCAAIWFHWTPERGGYLMRVCQDMITVGVDLNDDKRVIGELPLAQPIPLTSTTRVQVAVRGGEAEVFRDKKYLGTVELTESFDTGQALLGISVDTVTDEPPYTVTFANVDIRSLED